MRRILFAVLLLLAACGDGGSTPPAVPDGPFAVGTTTMTFVDPSRPTAANGNVPEQPSRTLRTAIYYPAQGSPGSAAVTDAPPLSGRRFPLLVFAHGFTAVGRLYFVILEAWAAAGYVVIAPDFPLSRGPTPGGAVVGDYINQPADESFLIDELLRLDGDPSSPLFGLIDGEKIGASGQSLGGMTTFGLGFHTCCGDSRVGAAVPMAGRLAPYPAGDYDPEIGPPLLIIHGDVDDTVPYSDATDALAFALPPACLLTHVGGGHILPYVGASDPDAVQATIDASTAFFDHYLKRERGALERLMAVGKRPRVRLDCAVGG